jgi:hypothetical protein
VDRIPKGRIAEWLKKALPEAGWRCTPCDSSVTVMADGFAHDGKTFASLSEIASEITGTRWNGPRFFGLRSAPDREGANGE